MTDLSAGLAAAGDCVEPPLLSTSDALTLLGAEVAVLIALLVVATFVQAFLGPSERVTGRPSTFKDLDQLAWARNLARHLLFCGALTCVAIGLSLTGALNRTRYVQMTAVAFFAIVMLTFAYAGARVLTRLLRT